MKTYKQIAIIFMVSFFVGSCIDYLEKTPEADVSDQDIFGTFASFQGIIEPMYDIVMSYNQGLVTDMNIGGETLGNNSSRIAYDGTYRTWIERTNNQTIFNLEGNGGIWSGSWRGIRMANLALEKLPLLVNATQEEKNLIEGQAYFFRAFFHWEIIRSFGGMPYIDRLLSPNDDLTLPRLRYQETTEKIVADFDRAATLLPFDWDNTTVGSAFQGANAGRATKGAALGLKAKALLFAGSPLMNFYSGKTYSFDNDYMRRAAEAAWEVIKLANQGMYTLVPFANYMDMFAKNDGTNIWTTETIFQPTVVFSRQRFLSGHGRLYSPSRFGGNTNNGCVNQVYVDLFEMADGTRYKLEYDNDNARRWDDRDPRFRQNILVDRDQWGFSPQTLLTLYFGGERTTQNGFTSPYIVKKFWPKGANTYDNILAEYGYVTPHLRLAEIYLIYAEAVNEAYGPTETFPGAGFTAVDAINAVRLRAGMPATSVAAATAAGYDSFRDLIRNERAVELCFESTYWFDIRRWYVAHLPEYREYWDFQFDKDWTSFTRVKIRDRVFEDPRHYWMPLPVPQTQIYRGFNQNPGW